MNSAVNSVESVHACYCSCSGLSVNLRVHERAIVDFLAHGFTEDDLRMVLLHLKRENGRMSGASYSLRIDRLLDFEYRRFDSLLSEARAQHRNRVVRTPAERVLATRTGGVMPTHTGDTSRAAGEVARAALATLKEHL